MLIVFFNSGYVGKAHLRTGFFLMEFLNEYIILCICIHCSFCKNHRRILAGRIPLPSGLRYSDIDFIYRTQS